MKGRTYFFATIALMLISTANATNDSYYLAVQGVKDGRYNDAVILFRTQLNEFADNPAYATRSKAWLALTLLAEDRKSPEAEKYLREILCVSLSQKEFSELSKICLQTETPEAKIWQPETQLDINVVSTAITAFGAMQWHKGEYQLALELMNLSLHRSIYSKPSETHLEAFELLNANKTQTPTEIMGTEQIKQALIKQKMKDELLERMTSKKNLLKEDMQAAVRENQQALVESHISEMLATQQQVLAQPLASKNNALANKKLARIAASEFEIFQKLAKAVSCQNEDDNSELNLQNIQNSQLNFLASLIEAYRGQQVQGFKIIQRPILNSLNKFLDTKQQFFGMPKPFSSDTYKTSADALSCFDTLNLEQRISEALLVAMMSPARPHRNEQYLKQVIDTSRRLRESQRFGHSSANTQTAIEYQVLGTFYLRTNQAAKAIPELEQAFTNYKTNHQLVLSPELAYVSEIARAKILQALAAASQQLGSKLTNLKKDLALLLQEVNQLKAEVAHQFSITPEQARQAQLDQVKQQTTELLQNEEIKGMMKDLESVLALAGDDKDIPNPTTELSKIAKMLNSGAVDTEILNLQKQLESDAPVQQDDVLGLNIERKFKFYNDHALLLLQLAQIELDLNNLDAAKDRFAYAQAHIKEFSAWTGKRTQGYLDYTQARLFVLTNEPRKAAESYASAVNAWYFTPRSPYQIFWNPLQSETDILEQAAAFSIAQGDAATALSYLELARDVNSNKFDLYGALSSRDLAIEDDALQQTIVRLEKLGAQQAQQQGEADTFNTALAEAKAAEQRSRRGQLDKNYPLLRRVNAIAAWLQSENIGPFVDALQQQISRRNIQSLDQMRIDFLYQQQGLTKTQSTHSQTLVRQGLEAAFPKTLQQKISDDSLLLSIWMGQRFTYVVALDKKEIRAHQEPSEQLLKYINAFNYFYKTEQGFRLYQKLFSPYLNRSYARIIVVSNGPLQNTALAALSTRETEQKWLGDQYLLRTAPKAKQLLAEATRQGKSSQALVLDGSSVPGEDTLTTYEIATIEKFYATKKITSVHLTKQNLVTQIPQYPIVHFAGHSKVNNEFPNFSYLALYNEQAYALELEQLPLRKVKLLVLGSCESAAHADSTLNNEFTSLQESFLNAGADSVVANLFPTNDKVASDFMSEFYTLLAQGLPKDRALQKAQQFIRANKPNPKDWAGFVLSGDESPL